MTRPPTLPSVQQLTSLQNDAVIRWHQEPIENPFNGFERLVCVNHQFNFRLWHEEDKARNPSATDSQIANVKRAIDQLNQARNDAIEQIDDKFTSIFKAIAERTSSRQLHPDSPINTETPGSAIDRLSIMALRVFHYREQAHRDTVDEAHRHGVSQRITLCEQQHADLSRSLQELLDDLAAGRKQHRTYRQMKMYNDPSLNPAIYDPTEPS